MTNPIKIIHSTACPTIPWEERREINLAQTGAAPIWRSRHNPIIGRNPITGVCRIFNSAVVPFGDGFSGIFRGDKTDGVPSLYYGHSSDGCCWNFCEEALSFTHSADDPGRVDYAYDPRVAKIEDAYYISWCTEYHGPAIGLARTTDFKTYQRLENPFLPFNRNAVLFPRKIHGNYMMLSRPSDTGHTPFGDIFLSQSPDLIYWGKHQHVMGKGPEWWQGLKIGAGAVPIETTEGWLLFYHGVTNTCNGYVYSMGGAILDLDDPSIVRYRCRSFLLTPECDYEERGFVPNVLFPSATLQDAGTGRIAIYYGAADSYVALAFTEVNEIVDYIKSTSGQP